jgi:hypothetical protein
MKTRATYFLCIFLLVTLTTCEKIENPDTGLEDLKIFNLDVKRVKKVNDLFALISNHEVVFLDASGNKKFSLNAQKILTTRTFKFRFTDVVSLSNNNICVLGTEICYDKKFRLYLFRLNQQGEYIGENPRITEITDEFHFDSTERTTEKNLFFAIEQNGYALATHKDNELIAVVNYQNYFNENWYYRLVSFKENGDIVFQKPQLSTNAHTIWTYLIDLLPDNTIIIVQGNSIYVDISLFNPDDFTLQNYHRINKSLNYPIFTNMLPWSDDEVVFTGYADLQNNPPLLENFDVFCIKYNFRTNIISDSLFSGRVINNEFCYHSYIDHNKFIHCIGARRGEQRTTQNKTSSLLEVVFNLDTHIQDSIEIINNQGYEGMYAEPADEFSASLKILGNKLDISGKENFQGFYLKIKAP